VKYIILIIFSLSFFAFAEDDKSTLNVGTDENFKVSLFADAKLLHGPIAIEVDKKGRVYVAEVHRLYKGVMDSRRVNEWFLDEIACNSLEDRIKLFEKWTAKGRFKEGFFTEYSDRIVTLFDHDKDGVADEVKEFSGKYNQALAGNGSSILMGPDNEMYYANIPAVYKITDKDGDGVGETKEEFISGFGFRNGVAGHDLHGLEWGVDGRLYFSNGDRGYEVTTKEGKVLRSNDRGAVFRCEADGSGLEEFTIGNRNPQDLGFDQYGNLFTVDNNRGGVDMSRVCYLVELGDYAWSSGHENKRTFNRAVKLNLRQGPGPSDHWAHEGDWREKFDGQAAYCIPSLAYIKGGSCGITFTPGDSLGAKYKNKFVYCAYSRGLYTFNFIADGAGLKIQNLNNFWKSGNGSLIDTAFDADGKLYVADYVSTSNGDNKGAIYLLQDEELLKQTSVLSAAVILKSDLSKAAITDLYKNLFHEDMRVRLFSQFQLVKRGAAGKAQLEAALKQQEHELARLHGLWGLGQLARQDSKVCESILAYLADGNSHVRAQSVKVIGEALDGKYYPPIVEMLKDADQRVVFFALTAAGKLGGEKAVEALIEVARKNNDKDVFLRHSAVAGLIHSQANDAIFQYCKDDSAAVRRVALLALARLQDLRTAEFLADSDITVVKDAIRAIDTMNNHQAVRAAIPKIAMLLKKHQLPDMKLERINQWLFRVGTKEALELSCSVALNEAISERIRAIALSDMGRWHEALPVDPVIGLIRPIDQNRAPAVELLKKTVAELLKMKMDRSLTSRVNSFALQYSIGIDKDKIIGQILDKKGDEAVRMDYYQKLLAKKDPQMALVTQGLLNEPSQKLRIAAYVAYASIDRQSFNRVLNGKARNKQDLQAIYKTLALVPNHNSTFVLVRAMNQLLEGTHQAASTLDLLAAVKVSKNKKLVDLLKKYTESLSTTDHLAAYRPTLVGGDAENGKKLIHQQLVGQCIVCHKMAGTGGIVAPDLSNIGNRQNLSAEYLLESILFPNKVVVAGFGNMTITMKDGSSLMGSLMSENKELLKLKMTDGTLKDVKVSEIKTKSAAISTMPPMGQILKKHEIRDIIAYLKSLKQVKAEH
jgi:quinoprotein glucose dehydrogenase